VSAPRFLLLIALATLVALTGLSLLPQDRYQRFAEAATESKHYLRIKWIYERIHFDETPIDVAFIGTSHTQSAVDSRIVEAALRARGQDVHVVNFAVPHLGRDLHWLLVRELLTSRRVRELVVEVQDFEPRAPHPAFQRLGSVGDLVESPLIVNTGFFDNLARLPRRQLDLFMPAMAGRSAFVFSPRGYEGPHWDDTERLHGFDQQRTGTHPAAYLDEQAELLRTALHDKERLAGRLRLPSGCSVLKHYNRFYLDSLLNLARERGVHVTFLYLPFFRGPEQPLEAALYEPYGPIVKPQGVLDDVTSWLNVDHLNVSGARRTSQWLGDNLAVAAPGRPLPAIAAPCS